MESAYQTPWWAQHEHLALKTQVRNSKGIAFKLKRLHRLFRHLGETSAVRDKRQWVGHSEAWDSGKHAGLTAARILLFCVLVFSSRRWKEWLLVLLRVALGVK